MDLKQICPKEYEEWARKLDQAKKFMLEKNDNKVLIECAAQHPLKDGKFPGEEFEKRLDKTIELYNTLKQEGKNVKIYVPGSRHMQNGVKDKISLSLCGKIYLVEHGVPANDVYSVGMNQKYKGLLGVFNSADECFVASQIFKNENFERLISVVSPAQMYRKTLFYIQFGIMPLNVTAPTLNSFHNYINEVFCSLPKVLTMDSTWQANDSEFAYNSRNERCCYLSAPITNLCDMENNINNDELAIDQNEIELEKKLG